VGVVEVKCEIATRESSWGAIKNLFK
jgi:hypothetical protein